MTRYLRIQRVARAIWFPAACLLLLASGGVRGSAQAALLMEEPYGIAGAVNPTGHDALYFARICAATPVKLRRCAPEEPGVVIARYQGVAGYDWIAIPLIPYLYAVQDATQVPERADRSTVNTLRREYIEAHLRALGPPLPEKGRMPRNWFQLVGSAYDRRTYVFRFATTEEQDDALLARLNAAPNRSHFSLIRNNCADFAAGILDFYFPHVFHRRILPDAGITTPRQNTWELLRYARHRAEVQLTMDEIPQIPGNHRPTRMNKGIAESLLVTGDVLAVAAINPFLGGAVCIDYLVWGRYPIRLAQTARLAPDDLEPLLEPLKSGNPASRSASTTRDEALPARGSLP